jgi:hypothetical protein
VLDQGGQNGYTKLFHAAVCSLAARHLYNQGETKFESVSLSKEDAAASALAMAGGSTQTVHESDQHVLLASRLLLLRIKVSKHSCCH